MVGEVVVRRRRVVVMMGSMKVGAMAARMAQ